MSYLNSVKAVVHVHPSLHPSSRTLRLQWPGWLVEYVFDTTRAAVNYSFPAREPDSPAFASFSPTPAVQRLISPCGSN